MAEITDRAQATAGEAQGQGREVASHASDQAQQVAGAAKDQAKAVLDEAKQRSREVAGDARREMESQGDAQAKRASDALRDMSRQLHGMVTNTSESGFAVDLAREAGQRAESVASRLDEGGVGGVIEDVQRFARRRPGLFLLGAGIAGFAAGRVLRNADLGQIKQAATSDSGDQAAQQSFLPTGKHSATGASEPAALPTARPSAAPVVGTPAPIDPRGPR